MKIFYFVFYRNLKDKTSKSTKTKFTVLRPKSRREPINYSENESSYGDYDYNSASYNGDDVSFKTHFLKDF